MTGRLLQVKEVAQLLGMSHSTVLRYAKAGEFKAFRISSNALRHGFASNALAGGVSIFQLARLMGTSVQMIDRTYGHLVADSESHLRDLLSSEAM